MVGPQPHRERPTDKPAGAAIGFVTAIACTLGMVVIIIKAWWSLLLIPLGLGFVLSFLDRKGPRRSSLRKEPGAEDPPVRIVPTKRIGAGALRCVYCHDLLSERVSLACESCRALFHHDCFSEVEGCTTLGCREAPPRRRYPRRRS